MASRTHRPAVWLVGGTRPEALKLAPVVDALRRHDVIRPVIVSSGQHPTMFHQGLAAFGLEPDHDLVVHRPTGSQAELVAALIECIDAHLQADQPAAVLVQGDTATALAGALAAFWRRIPVVHLEAGLRSQDLAAPFPEEANRRMIDQIATLHLAPTAAAAANLRADGISAATVHVTGNTIVDAVLSVAGRTTRFADGKLRRVEGLLSTGQRLILVTVHRRESWGEPLRSVLGSVRDILEAHPDTIVVLPTHPNPAVGTAVNSALGTHPRVVLTGPVDYPDLVRLLERSTLVLSDSGGIQEEAPSFGVPVLVLRDRTERMEAVQAGCAVLVGTDRARITSTAGRLLAARSGPMRAARPNPFGDGHSAQRSAAALARLLGLAGDRRTSDAPDWAIDHPA